MVRKILVVDDSPVDRQRLENLLGNAGYAVSTASDGAQGVATAKSAKPDLILMDINMPGMDGFAATRALHSDETTKNIPVVMITAKNQKADKAWSQMLGAKGFVTKPFTDEQLLAEVKTF